MGELGRRLLALFRRRSMDRDLERELQFHLKMKALETGDTAAAERSVGNHFTWRERGRDVWGWRWLDETVQDVRFAIRGLRRSPGFAVAAILTLALAIGANCLVFTVADATLLRPLPFPDPERLVFVWHKSGTMLGMPSIPQFLEWRASRNVFEELGAQRSQPFDIGGGSYSEQITGQQASASFFQVLGVEAVLGRTFLPEEEITGNDHVLLISDRLWRTRFGSDPKVVGTTMSGTGFTPGAFTIVGVLPPGVQFADSGLGDIWIPLARDSSDRSGNLNVVGKLKAGLGLQAAQQALTASGDAGFLRSYQEDLIKNSRPAMWVLGIAVSLVLLIACVNVANLTLARGADRIQELTIRVAIGAGRRRLLRQLLTESLLLGLIGGALGTAFAYASVGAVKGLMPRGVFRGDTVAVDARALAFTLAISLVACVLFGLLPALSASRVNPRPGLLARRPAKRTFLRGGLVVTEIALALMLVTGAGLMTKSLLRLVWKDLGFDRQDRLTLRTGLPMAVYNDTRLRIPMEREIVSRLQSLPGVRHVSISDTLPLGSSSMSIAARKSSTDTWRPASLSGVTPGFFDAMGIPVRDGRRFTDEDIPGGPEVAIVNEAAARVFWPDDRPIGKSILVPGAAGKPETALAVVGVVGDTIGMILTRKRGPAIYTPHAQRLSTSVLDIVVRVAPGISTAYLIPAIRTELASVDRTLSVREVITMQSVIDKQLAQPRFLTTVLAIFAVLALALTITGVVGVVAYLVRSRTYEFGVRMALGATSGDILRLILSYGGRLAMAGIVLGIAGALGLTRLLTAFLYEVKPIDTATMISVPLLVLVAVLLACYGPARQAMRIDPAHSLRHD